MFGVLLRQHEPCRRVQMDSRRQRKPERQPQRRELIQLKLRRLEKDTEILRVLRL